MTTTLPTDHPLTTIREELVAAATRRASARRRRRRALAATGIAVPAVAAATAGATALTGFTTGVPMIDGMLDEMGTRLDRTEDVVRPTRGADGLPPRQSPPSIPDVRPGAGGASPPLEVRMPPGPWSERWVGVTYLNRDGDACFALGDPDRTPDEGTRSMTGCRPVAQLEQAIARVEHELAAVPGSSGIMGRSMLVQGFAREDAETVKILGPYGTVEAALGEPWTPTGSATAPVRPFAAWVRVLEADPRHLPAGERADALREAPSSRGLPLEVELSDGTTERIAPPR